jgi:hypothetical protein
MEVYMKLLLIIGMMVHVWLIIGFLTFIWSAKRRKIVKLSEEDQMDLLKCSFLGPLIFIWLMAFVLIEKLAWFIEKLLKIGR